MNHQIKTAALSTIALSLLGCNQAQPQVEGAKRIQTRSSD